MADFDHLRLTDAHRSTLTLELDLWHRVYLPVKGTVLDVGAGSGETAAFYLNHGAERVICIESDPAALECLRHNFDADPRVTIIEAKLDNIKIDVEGGERDMVFETHDPVKFRRMWTPPRPARDVYLWKLQTNERVVLFRSVQQRLHEYRLRIAHRLRLILDKL